MNACRTYSPLFSLAAFGLAVCALAGCGRQEASVSGKVTYKGKLVQTGIVDFMTKDNVTCSANIVGGTYRTEKKVPVGENSVAVMSPNPGRKPMPPGKDKDKDKDEPKAPPVVGWFPIPDEYGSHLTTKLKFTVRPDENTFDIDLVGDAPKAK